MAQTSPPEAAAARPQGSRVAARAAGYLFVLVFFALSKTGMGFRITYFTFTASSAGELNLWLATVIALFPAACLLGYGYAPGVAPVLRRVADALDRASTAQILVGLVVLGSGLAAGYWALNGLVMLGYPFTDDELGTLYGGQILASGRIFVPQFEPFDAFQSHYLYVRDGMMTSMDWLGPQVAWAVGEATGLGNFTYALVAALPAPFVAALVSKRLGRRWGALACSVFLLSPMSVALSITTHTHVLSRTFLAIALCLYVYACDDDRSSLWLLCGLATAIAFVSRPFEIAFLAFPFAIVGAYDALRSPSARRAAVFFVLGAIPVIGLFALHSYLVTGNPLVPARFSPGTIADPSEETTLAYRFSLNVCYNLFLLTIWFLGPLGVILVAFGVSIDRFTKTLGASMVSVLSLGMAHSIIGIHTVGPIHYSECVVPLSILAAYGAADLRRRLAELRLGFGVAATAIVFALTLGLVPFSTINMIGMREQATIQSEIYEAIEQATAGVPKAVLLAPPFSVVWRSNSRFEQVGSFVGSWRRPRLDYSDRVLIFQNSTDVEAALRAKFPDRAFFRLLVDQNVDTFTVVPVP